MESPASSHFTTSSPVLLPSPLSSSTSPRYLPQSVLSGEDARPVPLIEHIRRLRCGSGGSSRQSVNNGLVDHSATTSTAVPALANVGLKDLLLSSDDDSVVTPALKSANNSAISPTTDCNGTVQQDCSGSEKDRLFDRGRIFMSEGAEKPDSSTTKRSKPAVLLMRLLSRPEGDADEDGVAAGSSSSIDASTNMASLSPPTSGVTVSNQSDVLPPSAIEKLDGLFDNHSGIQGQSEDGNLEQPMRNNLLRVL